MKNFSKKLFLFLATFSLMFYTAMPVFSNANSLMQGEKTVSVVASSDSNRQISSVKSVKLSKAKTSDGAENRAGNVSKMEKDTSAQKEKKFDPDILYVFVLIALLVFFTKRSRKKQERRKQKELERKKELALKEELERQKELVLKEELEKQKESELKKEAQKQKESDDSVENQK